MPIGRAEGWEADERNVEEEELGAEPSPDDGVVAVVVVGGECVRFWGLN